MFRILSIGEWLKSPKKRTETLLKRYLLAEVSLEDVIKAVSGLMTVNFSGAPAQRSFIFHPNKCSVAVNFYRSDVVFILKKYLDQEITLEALSDWAAFIFMSELFTLVDEMPSDPDGDGSPVWYVLQRLSTPSLFNIGDRNSIDQLLMELDESSPHYQKSS
jgi:hypothetical protein